MRINIFIWHLLLFLMPQDGATGQVVYRDLPNEFERSNSRERGKLKAKIEGLDVFNIEAALPLNHVRDGSVDYTMIIQRVLDSYNNVVFPNYPLQVNDSGLLLKSNSNLIFRDKSELVMKPSKRRSYSVFSIRDKENVNIYFPKIRGDRKRHLGKDGEWGMGISIYGSKNIRIYQPIISECWGDGIYISNSKANVSKNILIEDAMLDYNRRNGLTIVGGVDIKILAPTVSNTIGTNPMSGIDIEPNKGGGLLDNILIKDFVSFNNGKSGLQIGLSRYPDRVTKDINISIRNYHSQNNETGILLGGFYTNYQRDIRCVIGLIRFEGVHVVNARTHIKVGKNYHFGPQIIFRDLQFDYGTAPGLKNFDRFKVKVKNIPELTIQ